MFLIMLGAFVDVAAKCFEKALKQTNTSLKWAALTMGIDPAQLRRQLDGHEHLSMRRTFDAMPEEFLQHFAMNLVVEVGFPADIQTATAIARRFEEAS